MFLSTVEVSIGAAGNANLTFVVPRGDGNGQALVVVEYLGGEVDPGFEVGVSGLESGNLSAVNSAAVFAGPVDSAADEVVVNIWGRVGSRFRIFTGWANRKLQQVISGLPCSGCRMALKAVLRAGLAAAGVPMPGDVVADLLEAYLPKVLAEIGGTAIGDFLREAVGNEVYHRVLDTLGSVLVGFTKALKRLDDVCRAVCREVGLCD